jgi:hypothetical protein
MRVPKPLWHKNFDGLPDKLNARIAKHSFYSRIHLGDGAFPVTGNYSVRGKFEKRAEERLTISV